MLFRAGTLDLPFGRELDRFLEVLTAADDRSADRNAIENDVEQHRSNRHHPFSAASSC